MKLVRLAGLFLFLLILCFRSGIAEDDNASQRDSDTDSYGINRPLNGPDTNGPLNSPDTGSSLEKTKTPSGSPLKTMEEHSAEQNSSSSNLGAKNLSSINPERYFIQPGDTLSVQLWLPRKFKAFGTVSPTGDFIFDPIGNIPVQGVSLKDLSSHIQVELKHYYRQVRVAATLTDPRTARVQILGEVKKPGAREASGAFGVLDLISNAGLTDKSSLRGIELRKDGKLVKILDYFKWRIFGDQDQNVYIEPNEVVFVPVLKDKVGITGEVIRPGAYEFLSGETYQDLLHMAGGYTSEAMTQEIKMARISGDHSQISITPMDKLPLENGDSVYVPPVSLFQQKIRVVGELNGPAAINPAKGTITSEAARIGWYHLHQGEKVRDVVLNLGGLTPKADAEHARVERKNEKGTLEYLPVNLKKLFADNDMTQNLPLKDGDTLVIPSIPDSVYVVGDVAKPGVFSYVPGNQVREYMALAGGPTSHANLTHAKLVRVTTNPNQPEVYNLNLKKVFLGENPEKNLSVEPGDVIFVPHTDVNSIADIIGLVSNYAIVKALFFR